MAFSNVHFVFVLIVSFVDAHQLDLQVESSTKIIDNALDEDLILSCGPNVEDPNFVIQLESSDVRCRWITSSTRSLTSNSSQTIVLIFSSWAEVQNGNSTCRATNITEQLINNINNNVELGGEVFGCIGITPEVEDINSNDVDCGITSIKCNATFKPPLVCQRFNLRDIQDTLNGSVQVQKMTRELLINSFESNDGVYKCNNLVEQMEVKVDDRAKLKIFEFLDVTSSVYNETIMTFKVRGKPPSRVTFRKLSNRKPFMTGRQPDDPRITLEQQFFEGKDEIFGVLTIYNLSRTDDGLYECIAENEVGRIYATAHITVEFPPTFERTKDFPVVWAWENNPGTLSCLPDAIPNATITWRIRDKQVKDSPYYKQIGASPVSYLIVNPYNSYTVFTEYECVATNKLGSAVLKTELRRGERPRYAIHVRRGSLTANTIKWNIVPDRPHDKLPIRSFMVQYKPSRKLTWDFAVNHTWSYGAPYLLKGLRPKESYDFRFAAINDVGMGAYTNVESVTMLHPTLPAKIFFIIVVVVVCVLLVILIFDLAWYFDKGVGLIVFFRKGRIRQDYKGNLKISREELQPFKIEE